MYRIKRDVAREHMLKAMLFTNNRHTHTHTRCCVHTLYDASAWLHRVCSSDVHAHFSSQFYCAHNINYDYCGIPKTV